MTCCRESFLPCTVLSTAQALKEWDTVLKLLAEVKAHAAAHPTVTPLPANLAGRLSSSNQALSRELAAPAVSWKQLLKKKVRRHVHPVPQ
jgi:hypothetical protein